MTRLINYCSLVPRPSHRHFSIQKRRGEASLVPRPHPKNRGPGNKARVRPGPFLAHERRQCPPRRSPTRKSWKVTRQKNVFIQNLIVLNNKKFFSSDTAFWLDEECIWLSVGSARTRLLKLYLSSPTSPNLMWLCLHPPSLLKQDSRKCCHEDVCKEIITAHSLVTLLLFLYIIRHDFIAIMATVCVYNYQ